MLHAAHRAKQPFVFPFETFFGSCCNTMFDEGYTEKKEEEAEEEEEEELEKYCQLIQRGS